MDNLIQVFNSPQFGDVRVVIGDNGEPEFCLKDVCDVLGLQNSAVLRRLDKGVSSNHPLMTSGGMQMITFVNEDGLYDTILDSRKPEAKAFRRWLTKDVLPSIRKTGAYMTDNTLEKVLDDPDFGIRLLEKLKQEKIARRELELRQREQQVLIAQKDEELSCKDRQIAEMSESSAYCDMVLNSKNLVDITQIAQDYGTTAIRMNKYLKTLGVHFKDNEQWILYAQYKGKGYVHSYTHKINENVSRMCTKWTQKGRLFLYKFLKEKGVLPVLEQTTDYRHPYELQIQKS